MNRQLRVRGRIVLVVSFALFSTTRHHRAIVGELVAQLWARGFASQVCFYEPDDSEEFVLFEAIADGKPDGVVCLVQPLHSSNWLQCFIDRGVRIIGLGECNTEAIQNTLVFAA